MTTLLFQKVLVLALGIIALHVPLIPVDHAAGGIANPDLLFCLVAAWIVRRPAVLPLPLVLTLGLAADLLLGRPLGLGALGLVLAAEALRACTRLPSFPAEILRAVLFFAAVLGGTGLLLVVTFAPFPGWEALARHWLATAFAYPLVAALVHGGLAATRQAVAR